VPIELLGRESFTWRFWRAPSWALAVVTGGLVAAGMTLGLVENLRDGSGGLGMMVFFGLILLVIWVTVLDALVGRTRGDASGLHVRTLFGSCHLQWEDVYSALQIRGGDGLSAEWANVTVRAPGGKYALDMPGTRRMGFCRDNVYQPVQDDRDGIPAWAVAQGYLGPSDSREWW
jgi:hypothetical protein